MTIREFVEKFRNKKIMNTKTNPDAVSKYINETLDIKTYIPYLTKKEIAEMIVSAHIDEADGVKKYDHVRAYVSFVMAMLTAHTNLQCSNNPFDDYDALAESGLLACIIEEFRTSYNECDIVLKMVVDAELEDNNVNVLVGNFLNKVSVSLDDIVGALKTKIENLDLKEIFGTDINNENLAALSGLLNKLK